MKFKPYFILKFSNTFKGCQFNSLLAFSFEKVSDSVIFFSFREFIGALFPIKSPTKAIDFVHKVVSFRYAMKII